MPSPTSEEHTSELQSHLNLVCRLLLEKKKKKETHNTTSTVTDTATRPLHHTHTHTKRRQVYRAHVCVQITACTRTDSYFFFFNDTATTEISSLSLHDALPI